MSWDWNRWPARAMDDIQRIFIETLMDSIRYEESHNRRPVALLVGEGFSRFWRTRRMRDSERAFSHSNIGEIDSIYGLNIVHDRFIDRVRGDRDGGDFLSELRIVAERGGGSEQMTMRATNDPSRLAYRVGFRGPAAGSDRSRVFTYQYIRDAIGDSRANDAAMAMPTSNANRNVMQQAADQIRAREDARVRDALFQVRPGGGPEPRKRNDLSDTMVAWLT